MSAKRSSGAPEWLREPTKVWWCDVIASYELEAHHVRLLTLAAEAYDRCAAARELLDAEGIVIGSRPHPAVAIERDSRTAFARLVRELDLDGAPLPDPRPPRRGRR